MTRQRITRILELGEILSFQTGFNLFNGAVVSAIRESISHLEPLSVITEPRYLKLATVSSFCAFTLISLLTPLVLFTISLVFLTLISVSLEQIIGKRCPFAKRTYVPKICSAVSGRYLARYDCKSPHALALYVVFSLTSVCLV